jgi:hypothetical protein
VGEEQHEELSWRAPSASRRGRSRRYRAGGRRLRRRWRLSSRKNKQPRPSAAQFDTQFAREASPNRRRHASPLVLRHELPRRPNSRARARTHESSSGVPVCWCAVALPPMPFSGRWTQPAKTSSCIRLVRRHVYAHGRRRQQRLPRPSITC